MISTGSRINVSSVGHAGYNAANEKHWVGRPFWERDGGEYTTSHTIDVFDAPVRVSAFGLPPSQRDADGRVIKCPRVVVQQVAGCNEGSVYEDLWIQGTLLSLSCCFNTTLVIPFDGRYRLRLIDCEPDAITVVQHRTGIIFDFGSLLR